MLLEVFLPWEECDRSHIVHCCLSLLEQKGRGKKETWNYKDHIFILFDLMCLERLSVSWCVRVGGWQCLHECVMAKSGGKKEESVWEKGTVKARTVWRRGDTMMWNCPWGFELHKGRRCSMQREWAVYLLQRSCLPSGLSEGARPHHYLSSCTCPPATPPVKLHPARHDGGERKWERQTESLLL